MAKTSPAKFYVWVVASLGFGLLTLETTRPPRPEAGLLISLLGFAVALEFVSVALPDGPTVSMTMGPMVAALLIDSPLMATIVVTTSSAIHNLTRHGFCSSKWIFNAGQYAISATLAGRAYSWAQNSSAPLLGLPLLGPLMVYIVTFFALNYLLVWVFFMLITDINWHKVLKTVKLDLVNYAMSVPSGIGAAIVYRRGGWLPLVALMGCLVLAAYFERESRQAKEQSSIMGVLYHVAMVVTSSLDLDRLMDELVGAVCRLVGCEHLSLVLYDDITGQMTSVGQRPEDEGYDPITSLKPILEKSIAEKKCVVERDSQVSSSRSVLIVPLAHKERMQGLLVVTHSQPGVYSEQDARLMTILSSQVAVALNNALSYKQVEKLAMSDPMTGLYNYRYFASALATEMRHADSSGQKMSLLYIDLDNFREINNTFGHLAGDAVLKEAASTIRDAVRESDIACRYAGDEFVIILPGTAGDDARRVLSRVRTGLEQQSFQVTDRVAVKVSASIGVATYPDDGLTEAELIDAADRAMYMEKENREWN